MELKNPTSNNERRILALIEEQRTNMTFGKILLELTITNGKISLVELSSVKKSEKLQ